MKTSRVCVVGSGPTGMCAVKHCLEYGLSVICYDDRPSLGGIWLGSDSSFSGKNDVGDDLTLVHDELRLNTSQFTTAYSDFPVPDDLTPSLQNAGRYQDASQFLEYLKRYAAKFGIDNVVQNSTTVIDVRRLEDSEFPDHPWQVTTKVKKDGSFVVSKSRHRYVIVASGFYRKPAMPEIPGMAETKIKIIHSGHCRFMRQLFENRKVLVMGGSLSAGDIFESTLRAGASKVTWAMTRNPSGRSILSLARQPFGHPFAWDEWITLFGELYAPFWLRMISIKRMFTFVHRRSADAPMDLRTDRAVLQDRDFIRECQENGRVSLVSSTVESFEAGGSAQLSNGERVEADICVICTGYLPSYPFLDVDVAQLALYRHCLAIDRRLWGLAFLYTTSFTGGIACEEMEARWLIHHLASGTWESEEVRQVLQSGDNVFLPFEVVGGKKRSSQELTVSLARELGCLPPLWPAIFSLSPWTRRKTLAAAMGPLVMQMFRLRGPHLKPEMGDAVLKQARIVCGWKFDLMAFIVDLLHVGVATVLIASIYRFFK